MFVTRSFHVSMLAGLLMVAQVSQGATSSQVGDDSINGVRSEMTVLTGISLGEPKTFEGELMDRSSKFKDMVTDVDLSDDPVDLDQWTDDQIESYYREAHDFTNTMLDQVALHPEYASAINTYLVAGKSTQRRKLMSSMTCMAAAIQGEAGGESYEGKLAVGETVMARADGRREKVCAVIFARAQFESMLKRVRNINADSYRAAKVSLDRGGKCGYDHFINLKLQKQMGRKVPKWVRNFEKWKCASKKVGQHTFYSSCNCKNKK